MFQPAAKGKKSWVIGEHKKLHHYLDLSDLDGAAEIQRYIAAGELKISEPSGSWILRSREKEVLLVELRQIQGATHVAVGSGKIAAFSFDPACIVRIPLAEKSLALYEHNPKAEPTAVYDWTPDDAYAMRAIRAIADASDPRVKAAIGWLKEYAKKEQPLELINGVDLAATSDALRSGKLAKRLSEDQKLLATLAEAIRSDPQISKSITNRLDAIAEEERGTLRANADSQIKNELTILRAEQLAALDEDIATLRSDKAKEISNKHDELERMLLAKKEEGLEAIRLELGAAAATLQARIDELTRHNNTLQAESLELSTKSEILNARLQSLREQEQEILTNIDRIVTLTSIAKSKAYTSEGFIPSQPQLEPGTPLQLNEVKSLVDGSPLLSAVGKEMMLRFLVLLLAGDVPVLSGPDVGDFLLIAETMFVSGTSAHLEGDPTIITFDDLWLRPGSNAKTVLAGAFAIADGNEQAAGRTRLLVIDHAERSGARFWFPTLADRARRGELPKHLLACITIEDTESDEAKAILSNAIQLDIRNVLAGDVVTIAVASGLGSKFELQVTGHDQGLVTAVPVLAPYFPQLNLGRAKRVAKAIIEAKNLNVSEKLVIDLFLAESSTDTTVVTQLRS
ncbi:hypothetical protein MJ904_07385 [Massilia sp. MB5]|uniref:hypothetical protein n=1 Tax=Massilia sp. MB5 TaxID=2919578 RepID=UPI001F0D2EE7|nr:hypothetical protein [Massilia sp. MB5]UMR31990.1 hypothetical protein MJ904_07385 [Massilia sp. MB5]